MKKMTPLLNLLFILLLTAQVLGEPPNVSATFVEKRLDVCLRELCEQAKLDLVIDSSVDDKTLTASFKQAHLSRALGALLKGSGAEYRLVGSTIVVGRSDIVEKVSKVLAEPKPGSRVSVDFVIADLRYFLFYMAKSQGLESTIADEVQGEVTLTFKSISIETAVQVALALQERDFVWEKLGSRVYVRSSEQS